MRTFSPYPKLVELRAAAVSAAAMLGAFGSALWLAATAGLNADIPALAVVLAVMLARTQRGSDLRGRLTGLVVVPVTAVMAAEVGSLLHSRAGFGDALFVVGISLSIWVRRFGTRAAKAGTAAAVPFIAALVTPLPIPPGGGMLGWGALTALITFCWVWGCQALAARVGFVEEARRAGGVSRAPDDDRGRRTVSGSASDRMALQMGVALAAAFVIGRQAFSPHWTWPVLTAFIVCGGNRGRGDVIYKSGLRVAGAAVGTAVATAMAGMFSPGDKTAVALILVVLAVASWLRAFSYAYWAGCVTAALSLLYGYFAPTGASVLATRLEGIVAGALIGITASWFVMPVKTTSVLRKRVAEARTALTGLLSAVRDGEPLNPHHARFDAAVERLNEIAKPLEAHRRLAGRRPRPHHADVIDVVRGRDEQVRLVVRGSAEPIPALEDTVKSLGLFLLTTRQAAVRNDRWG